MKGKRFFFLILKRFIWAVPLLLGITLISFMIMHLAPGDPTSVMMDPKITAQDMAQFKVNLGLDKPVYIQYFYWLKAMLAGNFGYSMVSGKPVLVSILERLPATLILSVSSLILILLITTPLGVISAVKKNSLFDQLVMMLSFVGLSIPTFWLGLTLILFFALKLNWFPTSGYLDYGLLDAGIWTQIKNILYHMFLPLLTITIGSLAGLTRYHRFGVLKVLSEEYIKATKARGIPLWRVYFKHALKNASLPLVTILGLQLPALIGGSFIIEFIFAWPGMGQLGVQAVFSRDYPILMGTLFFSSVLIIIGNLCADIGYELVDPRVKNDL